MVKTIFFGFFGLGYIFQIFLEFFQVQLLFSIAYLNFWYFIKNKKYLKSQISFRTEFQLIQAIPIPFSPVPRRPNSSRSRAQPLTDRWTLLVSTLSLRERILAEPFDQGLTVRSCCAVRRSERHTRFDPSDQNPMASPVNPNIFVHFFSLPVGPTTIVVSDSVIFLAESSSEPPLLISQAPSDKIQSPTKTF